MIELEGPRRYAPNVVAAAFAAVLDHDVEAKVLPWAEWCELYLSWGLTPRSAAAMVEARSLTFTVPRNKRPGAHRVGRGSSAYPLHWPAHAS